MIRSLFIDAKHQVIEEFDWEKAEEIKEKIGGGEMLHTVPLRPFPGHSVLADAEGIFKDLPFGFYIPGHTSIFPGNGFVIKVADGQFVSVTATIEEVSDVISYLGVDIQEDGKGLKWNEM